MALSRAKKTEKVQALAAELEHSTSAIIGTFKALTAGKDFSLRKTVREAGGSYRVVKNNIAAKAAEGTPADPLLSDLKGMTSMAYTAKDPVALAKALTKYSRENAAFTFKAGLVQGRVIDIAAINDLASMPPKEEIYAKLLYLINASATRLVTSINGVGRNLAVVLDQAAKENKFPQ